MKKFLLFVLLVPFFAFAQQKGKPASYAKTITTSDLQKHLYIVAGKEMQGRETATEGQKKAASYIEDHFKALGLMPGNKDSYQMNFPVFVEEGGKNLLEVNDISYKLNDDFQPYPSTRHTASHYFSEIVFAGHGLADSLQDDYKETQVTGKLVIILDGAPESYKSKLKGKPVPGFLTKVINAQKKGATAVLLVADNFPRIARSSSGT